MHTIDQWVEAIKLQAGITTALYDLWVRVELLARSAACGLDSASMLALPGRERDEITGEVAELLIARHRGFHA